MAQARQVHLAKLFDDAQGAMGLYTKAFIHFVRTHPDIDKMIAEKLEEPLDIKAYSRKNHSELEDTYTDLTSKRKNKNLSIRLQHRASLKEYSSYIGSAVSSIDFIFRQLLCTLLHEFFMNEVRDQNDKRHRFRPKYKNSRFQKEFRKLSTARFVDNAKQLYKDGDVFIGDPRQIINEGILSISEVSRWLCMHSKTTQDVIDQMRAACLKTVPSACGHAQITPIEMLAQGDNGYIAQIINRDFPTHINKRFIIRQATEDNPNIFNRKFVDLWYDRDLDIGGCPARTFDRRLDGVFMDFAHMYVEVMEKIKQYDDQLRLQKAAENDHIDTSIIEMPCHTAIAIPKPTA